MNISTKTRYGLRALIDLAAHSNGTPVLLKEIAGREEISTRYLENIFTKLRSAGILESCKGRGGGFYLAKNPENISILDIMEALDENTSFTRCIDFPSWCRKSGTCISREVWKKLNNQVRNSLALITIDSLVKEYKNAGVL